MGKTKISWATDVWNPIRGCSRVSAGCQRCYAEVQAARIVRMGKGKPTPYDGLVHTVGGEPRWTGEVAFDLKALALPLGWRKPRRIFVDSMSDLFHEDVTNEQIAAVFGVMAACPQHTFQVLTKRRMREWFAWVDKRAADGLSMFPHDTAEWRIGQMLHVSARRAGADVGHAVAAWPLPNVWLGVSVENQAAADERIPHLLATPAAVHFVSAEPLLGPIHLPVVHVFGPRPSWSGPRIDWVIAGCESGPGARPCSVEWLRSLRDQCRDAGVAFFLKQARHVAEAVPSPDGSGWVDIVDSGAGSKRKPGGVIELPYLDGVQHAAMPATKEHTAP